MDTAQSDRRPWTWGCVARTLWLTWPQAALTVVGDNATRVPVVGDRLQPLASAAALTAWLSRQVSATLDARRAPPTDRRPPAGAVSSDDVLAACTSSVTGLTASPGVSWPSADRRPPVLRRSALRRRYVRREAVGYGPDPAQVLDIWAAPEADTDRAPILIYVPGGAWVHGSRSYQGHSLLAHMADRGWLCLAIDYRVAPRHRWPRHIQDVKAAILWARTHAEQHGGDPRFVAIAGASAGGHLAMLAGLSSGDTEFDGHLDGADTSVDAVVSMYGRYDWEGRSTLERERFMGFLEHLVVGKSQAAAPKVFRDASPLARIAADAPPSFIVHGSADSVIPVDQARHFAHALQTRSAAPVRYLELVGAQHAFDLFDGMRTGPVCGAIGDFLDAMYRRHTSLLAG